MVVKDDSSKDMFPAYRKKCLADKRTCSSFQCTRTIFVVSPIVSRIISSISRGKIEGMRIIVVRLSVYGAKGKSISRLLAVLQCDGSVTTLGFGLG